MLGNDPRTTWYVRQAAVLKVERDEARAILRNFVAGMGVDDIDPRLDYVEAQISRVDLEAVEAYLASVV